MKKYAVVFTLILFAALVTLTPSCGNSAAEEQARLDSIRIADSLAAIAFADSVYQDSLRQVYEDSIAAHMDSLQNALDNAGRSGRSSGSSKVEPKEQPKVKDMNVEVKNGGKQGGMSPKLQPKEESLLDKKKGGNSGGGSLLDKKKGGGSGGGSVKDGGLLKKKKGGQP